MAQPEVTTLTPAEEDAFRRWLRASQITDAEQPDAYYDYRGLFKELKGKAVPTSKDRHFPDTYKQHGHPTFSVESRYSKGTNDGGLWEGDKYVAPQSTDRELTDQELVSIFDNPKADLSLLTAGEQTRLVTLTERLDATGRAKPAPKSTSNLNRLSSLLPSVGGAVGGIAGGVPGAALGGAAGEGYRQLATHGTELPGALMDVLRNLQSQPMATMKGAAAGVGEGLKNTGIEAAAQGAMEGIGSLATKALGSGARAVYRGYLKPSMAKSSIAKADAIVETALREHLPVTKAGQEQAERVIGELRKEVQSELQNTSGTVNLHTVAEKVRAFAKRKYNVPGVDPADYEAAMKVADSIDAHPSMTPKPPAARVDEVSLPAADQVKRSLQEGVGTSQYGVPSKAAKTSEKIGARETRLAIEKKAPSVGPLNQRESELIDAASAIARAVARESNKSPLIGMNTLASGAIGAGSYAKDGDPYSAAVWAMATRAALTPAVATRAAIVAARLGKMPNAVPANAARIAAAAVRAVLEDSPNQ